MPHLRAIMLLLLMGCAHTKEQRVQDREKLRRCSPILKEILQVQSLRRKNNKRMLLNVDRLKQGMITHQEHDTLRNEWTQREGELRRYVTTLYDTAHITDCM